MCSCITALLETRRRSRSCSKRYRRSSMPIRSVFRFLYFQGGKDKFTSVTDANQFVGKLKNNQIPVRYIFKKDEGKRFRNEENVVEYYQEIEQFLAEYLK